MRERAQRHGIDARADGRRRRSATSVGRRAQGQAGAAQPALQRGQVHAGRRRRSSVRARRVDGDGRDRRSTDTGIGIAPEDQAPIFEEFRQVGERHARQGAKAPASGSRWPGGSSSCTAGASGWRARSGEGSTFTFTLPTRRPWRGELILVVEDDEKSRRLVRDVLRLTGLRRRRGRDRRGRACAWRASSSPALDPDGHPAAGINGIEALAAAARRRRHARDPGDRGHRLGDDRRTASRSWPRASTATAEADQREGVPRAAVRAPAATARGDRAVTPATILVVDDTPRNVQAARRPAERRRATRSSPPSSGARGARRDRERAARPRAARRDDAAA